MHNYSGICLYSSGVTEAVALGTKSLWAQIKITTNATPLPLSYLVFSSNYGLRISKIPQNSAFIRTIGSFIMYSISIELFAKNAYFSFPMNSGMICLRNDILVYLDTFSCFRTEIYVLTMRS